MSKDPSPPSALLPDEVTQGFFEFLHLVRKQWVVIVTATAFCAGLSLVYSKSVARVYQSTAMIEFDPNTVRPLTDRDTRGFWSYWDNKEYYETQYKVLVSDNLLSRVVQNLGLHLDPAYAGKKVPAAVLDVAQALKGRIVIEPIKNTRLVLVKVSDHDPKQARRLCEGIVQTYIRQNLEKSVGATSEAVAWLNEQVELAQKSLEHDENALHAFKQQNKLPSPSINETSNMVRMEMQTYNEALIHTRMKKQGLLARIASLSNLRLDTPNIAFSSEWMNDPFLQGLRSEFLKAEQIKMELLAEGRGEQHPLVKRSSERVAQAKKVMLGEIHNALAALQRDLAMLEKQEKGEAALYETARAQAITLNMKEIEYHRLERTKDQNEKLYSMLLQRMKEADLARMVTVNNIRLIDAPNEPKTWIYPRTDKDFGIGCLIGLFLGFCIAWLRTLLDNTIKTQVDAEKKLGVTCLGMLPATIDGPLSPHTTLHTGPLELLMHTSPMCSLAEAARALRTNLMFASPDKPCRTFLVTSCIPREGKTMVACTLAIALAQTGKRVCLVDCDLRRPRLQTLFQGQGKPGLTHLLIGSASLEEATYPTEIEHLSVVHAGPVPPNPAELLHSEKFHKTLQELTERFDAIVLDSPPVLAVTDSAILSSLVDGVLFVVRGFSTPAHLSKRGLRTLVNLDAPLLGVILNAVQIKAHEYAYYHHYYGSTETESEPNGRMT